MEALFKGVYGKFTGTIPPLVVPSDDCSADLTANWTDVNGVLSHAASEYTFTVAVGALVVPSDDCSADLTANWTDVNGTLSHAASEYTFTVTVGANVATFTDEAVLTVGKKYRATVLAKNGTGVGATVRINALTNGDVVIENGTGIVVAAGYAIATVEWIATEIDNKVQVEIVAGTVGNGETVLFDTIETKAFNVATFTDEAVLTIGKKYRATVLAKNGTGVGATVRINALTNGDVVIENGTGITVAAGYTITTVEWVATEINNKVQIEILAGTVGNGETVLFDTITTRVLPDFYTDIGGRMYLAELPQGTAYPNATYQLVSNTNDWTFTEDFDNALIQFNLYSKSPSAVEITNAEKKLRLLYDNCALASTDLGSTWGHVYMHRDGSWLDKIPSPDSTGGGNIWRYVVEYKVMLTKGSTV